MIGVLTKNVPLPRLLAAMDDAGLASGQRTVVSDQATDRSSLTTENPGLRRLVDQLFVCRVRPEVHGHFLRVSERRGLSPPVGIKPRRSL